MFEKGKIYALDIKTELDHPKGKVFKGDQSKKEDLDRVILEIKKANIIIDDGSHLPEHQLFTFNYLFEKLLDFDGIYIIEDIETNYWKQWDLYNNPVIAGYNTQINIVNIFKNIVDIINREYLLPEHLNLIQNYDVISFINLKYISFIMFGQNCIIIKKMSEKEYARYGLKKYRYIQNL